MRSLPSIAAALAALWLGCDGEGEGESFAPIEEVSLAPPDEVRAEVAWSPATVIADPAAVAADVEDLDALDGTYRVRAGSSLLDGVSAGTVVAWSDVGLFRVTELVPDGSHVRVVTEPAALADAVTSADIEFEHRMTSGDPGRVIGIALELPVDGASMEPLGGDRIGAARALLSLTADGVVDSRSVGDYRVDSSIRLTGDTLRLDVVMRKSSVRFELHASVTGLVTRGDLNVIEGEEPVTEIRFDGLRADIHVVAVAAAVEGELVFQIPVTLTTPFVLPLPGFALPMYVSLGTVLEARATLATESSEASLGARYALEGSVVLRRGSDGSLSAEGALTRFEPSAEQSSISGPITAGLGLIADGPRVEIGVGRPVIATLPLLGEITSPVSAYARMSAEMVGNIVVNPFDPGQHCITLATNSALLVGGEVRFLSWSRALEYQLYGDTAETVRRGTACE